MRLRTRPRCMGMMGSFSGSSGCYWVGVVKALFARVLAGLGLYEA